MSKTIEDRVREIIVELLKVDDEQVTPEKTLGEDLGADSLDMVELAVKIEEEFYIGVSYEAHVDWLTVEDVVSYIKGKVK